MAERKNKVNTSKIAEAEERAVEVQKESTENEEAVKEQSVEEEPKQEEIPVPSEKPTKQKKSYIHIDTFLDSVQPQYQLSRMKRAGFKAYMNGNHYVRDESVFTDSLKRYLNIK